jgi:hypothetical protein
LIEPEARFFRRFLCAHKEIDPKVQGREPPAISFSKSKADKGRLLLFTPWVPAFAGTTIVQ